MVIFSLNKIDDALFNVTCSKTLLCRLIRCAIRMIKFEYNCTFTAVLMS